MTQSMAQSMKQPYPARSWRAHEARLVQELQQLTGLHFALLYGSAAADEPFHDLDIALYVDRAVHPYENDIDLAGDLADALAMNLPYPVDVRVINDAPLPFAYNVTKSQPLVIHDAEVYYTWLERTWDLWFDFKPIADQYLRDLR